MNAPSQPAAKADISGNELLLLLRNELIWMYSEVWQLVHGLNEQQAVKDRFRAMPGLVETTSASLAASIFDADRATIEAVSKARDELQWIHSEVRPLVYGHTCRQTVRNRFDRLPTLLATAGEWLAAPNLKGVREAFNECFEVISQIANTPADKYPNDTAWAHAMHSAAYKAYPQFQQVRAQLAGFSAAQVPDGVPVIDLDALSWELIKQAASESTWMPREYMANGWHSDVCEFLRKGPAAFIPSAGSDADVAMLRELCQRAGITLVASQVLRGRWNWLDLKGNASDASLESEREAALDALDSRFGDSWRHDVVNLNTDSGFIDYVSAELDAAEAVPEAEADNNEGMRP